MTEYVHIHAYDPDTGEDWCEACWANANEQHAADNERLRTLGESLAEALRLQHISGHTSLCAYINGACTSRAALAAWRDGGGE
jgi:hypothetical protein